MARDDGPAADGAGRQQLTTDGVRVLRRDASRSDSAGSGDGSGVLLQVLGVYRYLVDPALRQQLGELTSDTLERDVFDVLLSDGRYKMKCLLSPEMNHVVWRGDLSLFDVMRVTDFDAFQVKDGSENNSNAARSVCFIKGFEVIKRQSDTFLVSSGTALVEKDHEDDLEFVSTAMSERETNVAIPVAGERMYYLPLSSDSCALLDWAETAATKSISTKRQYCSSLFTSVARTVHNMVEIMDIIDTSNGGQMDKYPPMTGIVRVKSKVTHFGEPGIANPLPFVFHIVLVDSTFAFEIAFFGSSCAKYFGAIEEGDLIQLRGYSVSVTEPEDESEAGAPEQLVFFEHESEGEVLHIPEKFSKYLEMVEVIPKPVSERSTAASSSLSLSPIRLECSFASTLDTQYWNEDTLSRRDTFFFDFVGVLSYVGKVCRRRKRKRAVSEENVDGAKDGSEGDEMSSGPVGEYRWVKAVDRSSSTELVVLVQDCSQPQEFYNLKAGDTVMLTKLKWVIVDDQHIQHSGVDGHLFGTQYAACSSFTVVRVNDAVSAFNAIEDCSLNSFFAEKLVAKEKVREKSSTGESWLEGDTIKKYRTPSNTIQATDFGDLSPSLGRQVYQFRWIPDAHTSLLFLCSELSKVCESLEKLEHQHVVVIGRLLSIPKQQQADMNGAAPTSTAAYEIEFGDSRDSSLTRKATLRVNPLFKVVVQQSEAAETAVSHRSLKGITPKSSKLLLKTLSPAIVDELFAAEATSKSSENKKKRKRKHKKKNPALKAETASDGTTTTSANDNGVDGDGTASASVDAVVVDIPTTTTSAPAPPTAAPAPPTAAPAPPTTAPAPPTTAPAPPTAAPAATSSKLTTEFLEQQLTKSNRVFLFSTHLYRTQDGDIDVEVDAILPYALKV